MSLQFVLFPLFVDVALTFVLLFWMAGASSAAARPREAGWQDIALQRELPLLFYALTILSIIARHADLLFVLLAWVFVVVRLLQAYVHLTDNPVPRSGSFFLAAALVLAIMWAIFAIRMLLGLP